MGFQITPVDRGLNELFQKRDYHPVKTEIESIHIIIGGYFVVAMGCICKFGGPSLKKISEVYIDSGVENFKRGWRQLLPTLVVLNVICLLAYECLKL